MVYPDVSYGSKYDEKLTVKDIASKIREFVKVKNYKRLGEFSIRTSRYSGGRSLDVRITPSKNPYAFEPIYGNHQNGNADQQIYVYLVPEYALMLKELKHEIASYNYDGSDMMTDYYHVNFSSSVELNARDEMMKEAPQMEKSDKGLSEMEKEGYDRCRTLIWNDDYGYKEMMEKVG